MQIGKIAHKLQRYIQKRKVYYKNIFLSRNGNFIALPSVGVVACIVGVSIAAIGLIVGGVLRFVRSQKRKKEEEKAAMKQNIYKDAAQQKIDQLIESGRTTNDLTSQNINFYKTIQNTQEVMNNLNNLNSGVNMGI